MAHTGEFGAARPGSMRTSDELAHIEQDAHERPTTDRDPARPGGRSGLSIALVAVLFLLVVAFFFYALGAG